MFNVTIPLWYFYSLMVLFHISTILYIVTLLSKMSIVLIKDSHNCVFLRLYGEWKMICFEIIKFILLLLKVCLMSHCHSFSVTMRNVKCKIQLNERRTLLSLRSVFTIFFVHHVEMFKSINIYHVSEDHVLVYYKLFVFHKDDCSFTLCEYSV